MPKHPSTLALERHRAELERDSGRHAFIPRRAEPGALYEAGDREVVMDMRDEFGAVHGTRRAIFRGARLEADTDGIAWPQTAAEVRLADRLRLPTITTQEGV